MAPNLKDQRFLIDCDDLRAGLGHLMASFNIALKVASRNNLSLVAGLPVERRSLRSTLGGLRARIANPSGSKPYDHEGRLHSEYDRFLRLSSRHPTVDELAHSLRSGELRRVDLPEPRLDLAGDNARYAEIDDLISAYSGPGVVFCLPPGRLSRCDGDYAGTRALVQRLYSEARRGDPVPSLFSSGKISVAVNIRRGDVLRLDKFKNRLLPDCYYCTVINTLAEVCGPDALHVIVFSDADSNGNYLDQDGVRVEWARHPLLHPGVAVGSHLDERRWLEAFDHMVSADILVTSRSAFSHLACILSENTKIVSPMWKGQEFDAATRVIHADPVTGRFDISLLKGVPALSPVASARAC